MKRLSTLNFAIIPLLISMVILFSSCPGAETCGFSEIPDINFKIVNIESENLVSTSSALYHPDSIKVTNALHEGVWLQNDSSHYGWTFSFDVFNLNYDWCWLAESYENGRLDTTFYLYIPKQGVDTLNISIIAIPDSGFSFELAGTVNSMPLEIEQNLFLIKK